FVVALLLGLVPAGRAAETYSLAETVQPGDCFRVQLDMNLNGDMRVQRLDKSESLKLQAVATHEYPERILSVGKDGVPDKSARVYATAKATITVAGLASERTLRPDRRLVVAQRFKDQGLV